MEKRGFEVETAAALSPLACAAAARPTAYAVVENLRLQDGNGLTVVRGVARQKRPRNAPVVIEKDIM